MEWSLPLKQLLMMESYEGSQWNQMESDIDGKVQAMGLARLAGQSLSHAKYNGIM